MDDKDLYWLAGLLEGEGSFLAPSPSAPNSPRVQVSMTDADIVRRVATLFQVRHVSTRRHERKPEYKPSFSAQVKGLRAVKLMEVLRPLMGERRQRQIDAAVATFVPYERRDDKLTDEKVRELKRVLAPYGSGRLPYGMATKLAVELHVSRNAIWKVRKGVSYKHVA